MAVKALAVAGVAALGVGAGSVGAAAAHTPAPRPSDHAGCLDHWSVGGIDVEHHPEGLTAGSPSGVYVWHDCLGWHLRTTDPAQPGHLYAGSITVPSGRFTTVTAFKFEHDDHVSQPSQKEVDFHFLTFTHVDGVDFRVSGNTVTFDITRTSGRPPMTSRIFLGHSKANPETTTFTATRDLTPAEASAATAGGGGGGTGGHHRGGSAGRLHVGARLTHIDLSRTRVSRLGSR